MKVKWIFLNINRRNISIKYEYINWYIKIYKMLSVKINILNSLFVLLFLNITLSIYNNDLTFILLQSPKV